MDGFFDGFETEFVGGAVDVAAFHAAARQPHGEAVVVVVATIDLAGVGSGGREFDDGCAAEFAAPDHEGVVEHAALFEIFEEGADGLVAFAGEAAVVDLDIVVGVPRLAVAVPDLDEADPFFEETAGGEELAALGGVAVKLANGGGFAGDGERVGGLKLHAEGEFVRLDAGLELGFVLPFGGVAGVEFLEQVELGALFGRRGRGVADVFDEAVDVGKRGVDVITLIDAGEKTALPVLRFLDRVAAGAHGDEAGEILVFGAEAVGDPRAEGGAREAGVAAVHQHERRLVVGNVGVHRADHGDFVDARGDMREEFADLDTGLTVFFEFERRAERSAGFPLGLEVEGERFAVVFRESWFRVEGVDLGRAAVGKNVDDAFGFGGEVGRARGERVVEVDGAHAGRGVGEEVWPGEGGEAEGTETDAAAIQEITAGEEVILEARGVVGHG